jgi:hypothetical protein
MRLGITLSILLMVVAIVAMIVLIVLPLAMQDDPAVLNMMAAIACEPGQRAEIDVIVTEDYEGTGYTPQLWCIGREGERVDASGKHLLIAMVVFGVPLLLGIFTIIITASRAQKRGFRTIPPQTEWKQGSKPEYQEGFTTGRVSSSSSFSSGPVVSTGSFAEVKDGVLNIAGMKIPLDGLKPDQIQFVTGMITGDMSGADGSNATTLAAKLKEIQDARDAGLITAAEFDRLRQEILDKLT